jgi:hypothetical protein
MLINSIRNRRRNRWRKAVYLRELDIQASDRICKNVVWCTNKAEFNRKNMAAIAVSGVCQI